MRSKLSPVGCTFLLIASAASASPNGCTLGNAVYTTPVSHLHLSFVNIGRTHELVSDLAVHVVEPRSKKQFWFYFDQGSAPKVSLISTPDVTKPEWRPNPDGGVRPYGSATFIGMEKDGRVVYNAPSSKSSPPKYILIPELDFIFKEIRVWGVDANAFVFTACRSGRIASGAMANNAPVLADPNNVYNYLPRIRAAFDEFHRNHHHYPKVWYDIEVNCSDDKNQSGCSSILRGPPSERKKWTPFGPGHVRSRFTYVLVSSGRTRYRIEVRDSEGNALFYSDEEHVAVPIK